MKNLTTLKRIYKVIIGVCTVFFLALTAVTVLSLVGIPKQLGIFVVETGSMSPTIPAGSLIFDLKTGDYVVGDIITFRAQASPEDTRIVTITHRITQVINEDGRVMYETKGDANDEPDVNRRDFTSVIGEVLFHIPLVGTVVGFAQTRIGFIVLIIIPTTVIIFSELSAVRKELVKMRSKNKGVDVSES